MLTWEDDVEVHALRKRGWTISAIARHTGRDRKTIRAYLNNERTPGVRKRTEPDPFEPFVDYITCRLREDPHLWARTLCDELEDLGYRMSYQTLTRQIRDRELRPVCEHCANATDRVNAVIEHPPGEETQWDWVDLPNPPASWGWGSMAHLLVGSLAHSGRWRGVLAPAMTQPHLVDGLDRICRGLGGLTRSWRFDRMATVCHPDSGRMTASFAGVAKHYGVTVTICPARAGNRKGVVEKANHTAAQRWWRTLPDDVTVEQAQARLDEFCRVRSDTRPRRTADGRTTVGALAAAESVVAAADSAVSGDPHRVPGRVAAGVGVLSRQPVFGAAGVGVGAGDRHPGARSGGHRHRHRLADHHRATPPGAGRSRGDGPRPRSRPCARTGRDGRRRNRWSPASPQRTDPTRTRGRRGGTSTAPPHHRGCSVVR